MECLNNWQYPLTSRLCFSTEHGKMNFYCKTYQFLKNSSLRCSAQTVLNVRRPLGVSMYPTRPTTIIGGVSMIVTASTTSFLCTSGLAKTLLHIKTCKPYVESL